jgi:quercetin dioxygenase-like cupin family protein
MEKEMLKTKPLLRKDNRSPDISLRTFDLPALIEKMKHSPDWAKGDLNTMILLKRPDKQIVLTALHEGTEIDSFQPSGSITFQIIEGELKFCTQNESVILDVGYLLTLHENVKYSYTTKEETVFLLTITKGTSQSAKNKIKIQSN